MSADRGCLSSAWHAALAARLVYDPWHVSGRLLVRRLPVPWAVLLLRPSKSLSAGLHVHGPKSSLFLSSQKEREQVAESYWYSVTASVVTSIVENIEVSGTDGQSLPL